MDDFYAARDRTTPSLPWPSIAPPFTLAQNRTKASHHLPKLWLPDSARFKSFAEIAPLVVWKFDRRSLVGKEVVADALAVIGIGYSQLKSRGKEANTSVAPRG